MIPSSAEIVILGDFLNSTLTLKLYSNNITPSKATVIGDLIEVSGGGYITKALASGSWVITPGTPTVALYNAAQNFIFTGATAAPTTVYGYYIVDSLGALKAAVRFDAAFVPFTPLASALIRVTPKVQLN